MRKYLPLLIIVFLGTFLRFWQIDKVPPSLYWDEVSQGYNAYSILKTGKDEHGEAFPIARFVAFGDYKAPVYIYLDIPFIGIFGKTTFGVRFPSALFGSLTVLLTYFLVYELFYENKSRKRFALWSSFFLAISPWHIQLSRAAYEANVATFFTVLAVYLFLLAKRVKSWIFILSAISFVLGFYAFNAHRVFIPFLVILLGVIYFKDLLKSKKYIGISIVIGVILLLPFLSYFRTPESKLRFNEVNIFSDLNVIEQSNQMIAYEKNSIIARVFDNRRILYSLSYIEHYFDFYDPTYLFFTGDVNPRFSLQDFGELFLWELPLFVAGFYFLASQRSKSAILVIGWFLLAPVAAATARETPHALRSETFIPLYSIISSLGIVCVLDYIKKVSKKLKNISVSIFIAIVFVFLIIFLHDYFVHFPVNYAYSWQYGYEQAVKTVDKIKNDYDYVVVTRDYGRPYIYVDFYSNILPSDLQKETVYSRDAFGFYSVSKVGKYIFRKTLINASEDAGKKVLYVGKPDEIPGTFNVIKKIYFPKGDIAFVIANN